jgi:hypothetical protein
MSARILLNPEVGEGYTGRVDELLPRRADHKHIQESPQAKVDLPMPPDS